jgi:hypothetical protein
MRINLQKKNVEHSKAKHGFRNEYCFICGGESHHRVFSPAPINMRRRKHFRKFISLCTHHFVSMFHLPANRFPKKAKEKKNFVVGEFTPRLVTFHRHMLPPLALEVRKMVCHGAEIPGQVFYTLYKNIANVDKGKFILTTTLVSQKHKHRAISKVSELDTLAELVQALNDARDFFINNLDLGQVIDRMKFEIEATNFLVMIHKRLVG